jgi:cobalamin biosynthesis Mg chelatase CobN
MYVYASTDWPAWQQALRQDATSEYAARLPEQKNRSNALTEKIIPSWLCALVFVLCMLGLWWRERR